VSPEVRRDRRVDLRETPEFSGLQRKPGKDQRQRKGQKCLDRPVIVEKGGFPLKGPTSNEASTVSLGIVTLKAKRLCHGKVAASK